MGRNGADSTVNGRSTLTRRSDRFLAGLADYRLVTFVSHVHPDPDSLGSMLGLAHLVETATVTPREGSEVAGWSRSRQAAGGVREFARTALNHEQGGAE